MQKKTKITIGVVAIFSIAVFAILRIQSQKTKVEYSSVMAQVQDIYQTVSETGSVVADLKVEYGWEISGRVVMVNKQVGDEVKEGDIIAEIENTQQQSRLNEAQARLASAGASLQLALAGPSTEQRTQSAAAVTQAEATLQQAKIDLEKTIINSNASLRSAEINLADAESKLFNTGNINQQAIDDAYENALQKAGGAVIDALSAMSTMSNIQYSYSELINSSVFLLQVSTKKAQAVEALVGVKDAGIWRTDQIVNERGGVRGEVEGLINQINPEKAKIETALINTEDMLNKMKAALDEFVVALSAIDGASAADKASLDAARVSMDTKITTIINARQAIQSAALLNQSGNDNSQLVYEKAQVDFENIKKRVSQDIAAAEALVQVRQAALLQAKASYEAFIAPPRDVDIGSIRANILRELASVRQFQEDLNKTALKALANGAISELAIKVGENISSNQKVITIISPTLSIEVDVSESDIAKVSVNDPVSITLDAFGDDMVFMGHVLKVEPAETEISGVIYYKTDIIFDETLGQNIRPGMTANIDIETDKAKNVVAIPQRAILEEQGKRYVRVVIDPVSATFERREVSLGLRGNNGLVEITSGLSGGEEVVTFVKENE